MKKKIIIGLLLLALLTFSSCKQSDKDLETQSETVSGNYRVTSDGIYVTRDENILQSSAEDGELLGHTGDNIEVSAPEGSISISQAVEILESCAFEKFYLPQKVSTYETYYYKTVEINEEMYYMLGLYTTQKGTRLYLGTNVFVSCDGRSVMKQTWMGGYAPVEIGSGKNDKSFEELYPEAKITPEQALFVLAEKGSSALELTQDVTQYTFEIDSWLSQEQNMDCYRIVPKLTYEHSTKLFEPIYVSVDGKNRVFIRDKTKETGNKEVI